MIQFIGFALAIAMAFIAIRQLTGIGKRKVVVPEEDPFPKAWRGLLKDVVFYQKLDQQGKKRFEFKIQDFLANCMITGIETEVEDSDRVLIAASAVIPIFNFPDWAYRNLGEILLYADSFNEHYHTEGADRRILGMVGEGAMQGKMILSKRALHHDFTNHTDKHNTAVHEFVHLIDKSDGATDGVPELLLDHKYVLPWLKLIRENVEEIHKGKSDINPYAATNNQEFLAVTSEYFFERPELFQEKHPELYDYLHRMFGPHEPQAEAV
ncbi:MAG: M90 family metallopeptidase [Bacteroidota bacterium]